MVLRAKMCGRVGHCRDYSSRRPAARAAGLFFLAPPRAVPRLVDTTDELAPYWGLAPCNTGGSPMSGPLRAARSPKTSIAVTAALFALAAIWVPSRPAGQAAGGWRVVAWNNLGMHCMDADFSVFAILPPVQHDPGAGHRRGRQPGDDRRGITRHLRGRRRSRPARSTRPRPARRTSGRSCRALFGAPLPVDAGLLGPQHAGRRQHAAADDLRRRAQLVHRRRHPDHAVRRRGQRRTTTR